MDFLDFAPQTPRLHRQAKACEKSRSSNDDFTQRTFGRSMDSQNVSDSDAGGEEANLSNSGDFNKDQSETDRDSEDQSDEQSDEETPIVSVQERALLDPRLFEGSNRTKFGNSRKQKEGNDGNSNGRKLKESNSSKPSKKKDGNSSKSRKQKNGNNDMSKAGNKRPLRKPPEHYSSFLLPSSTHYHPSVRLRHTVLSRSPTPQSCVCL